MIRVIDSHNTWNYIYLDNVISCEVTEKRNNIPELKMVCPLSNTDSGIKIADWVKKYNAIACKGNLYDGEQIYLIHTIESDGTKITAYASHESSVFYNVLGCIIPSKSTVQDSMAYLASKINRKGLDDALFDFAGLGTSTGGNAFIQKDIVSAMDTVMNMIDYFGGELRVYGKNVDVYVPTRGIDQDMTIAYGKNISEITYEDNSEDAYNGVAPFYNDDDGAVLQNYLDWDPDIIPWRRNYLKNISSEYADGTKPTSSQLDERATAEKPTVSAAGKTNITVKASITKMDAEMIKLRLCDTVKLDYEPLNIKNRRIQLTQFTFDVISEQYTEMIFGEEERLTKTLIDQEKRSRTYTKERKSTSNKFNFTFTRNGNWVTVSQSGSVKPTATNQTLTAYIPQGYRPTSTMTVKASDPEKTGTNATYKFYKNGNITISHASGLLQGSRNFTIGYETKDKYPRNGY